MKLIFFQLSQNTFIVKVIIVLSLHKILQCYKQSSSLNNAFHDAIVNKCLNILTLNPLDLRLFVNEVFMVVVVCKPESFISEWLTLFSLVFQ